MWEREEHQVVATERLRSGRFERAGRERREPGVQCSHRLPGAGPGAERTQLQLGVPEQQAEQFAAGVPAGARDRDGESHAYMYTRACKFMHDASVAGWGPCRLVDSAGSAT